MEDAMILLYLIGAIAAAACFAIVAGAAYWDEPAIEAPSSYHCFIGIGISVGALGLPVAIVQGLWRVFF